MTSTVLDVTVLLLCVSASVVALGGVGDDVGARGPTAGEAADRLVTETVTVRYRAPEAANETRTVHATRAELLALLVADAGGVHGERGAVRSPNDADRNRFESRATAAVAAGIDERTRIDATVPTAANWEGETAGSIADRDRASRRGGRRAVRPRIALDAPNAPVSPQRGAPDGGSRRGRADGSVVTGDARTVTVGEEPPRNADVTTAVIAHPAAGETETDGPVRIVVRRW